MTRRRIVLLAVVVLALGGAAMLVPLNSLRGPIETAASRALDRQVRVAGSLHLTLFPEFGISLKNVSIANSAGAHDPEMVTVGKIIVGARLMPLLSGRLVTTKIVLKRPVIHLELGKDGVANWQFGARTQGLAENPFSDGRLGIKDARIENGEVTYFDAAIGKTQTLSAVSLTLAMAGSKEAGHKLTVEGTATHQSVPLQLAASLDDLDGFIKGGASQGRVRVRSAMVNIDFTGRLAVGGALDGKLSLDAPSLRRLAGWAGHPLPPGNGLGAVTVTAAVRGKDGVYTLSKADIGLDRMKLAGTLAIDARLAVPSLNGSLSVDRLDTGPYLAPGNAEDVTKVAKAPDRNTPLALGALKSADADLKLAVGGLVLPDFEIDRAAIAAVLKKGILQAQLTSFTAYGGSGKGTVTLDPSGALPTLRADIDMSGVRVEAFLAEMAGVRRIAGSGAIRLDIASRGRSELDIVRNLSGKGSLTVGNGSIAGADLGAVARLVQSTLTGSFLTGAVGDNARTAFGTLSASFTIEGGIVRVGALRLVNPVVEMTGAGTINLATRQIDFRFEPHALQGMPGLNLVDIGIPFYVRGSWDHPSFAPDTAGLAKGIVGTVGGLGSKAVGLPGEVLKAPGDVLHSLLGGN
ncbi:MAG TPA: AsmA family protein [Stellaceae bacterium]|jgi:AsmA protein